MTMLKQTPRIVVLGIVLAALLSALRLVLAFMLPFLDRPLQVAAVIVAALSDGLDGITARALGKPTWWGAWLDAMGDKLFALSAFATLLMQGQLAAWQVVVLLSRDLAVGALLIVGLVSRRWAQFKQVRPGILGKATTAMLFMLFLVLLAWPDNLMWHWLLFGVGSAVSIGAALDYLLRLRGLPTTSAASSSQPQGANNARA